MCYGTSPRKADTHVKISTLFSPTPITKSYTQDPSGKITYSPYPNVYEFTSDTRDVHTIEDLRREILAAARRDGCLLKGLLSRDLIGQSRAGATDPGALTEWICLDVDGVSGYPSLQSLLFSLGVEHVDHIIQWSSSMGIPGQKGLRCHVFMLLEEPTHPLILKNWLKDLNLSTVKLRSEIQLTKTHTALKWPLDVTTCQNDKLIYVAPPKLSGIINPYPGGVRFEMVKGSARRLAAPSPRPAAAIETDIRTLINDLRKQLGLKPSRGKVDHHGSIPYEKDPDPGQITGIKRERGFVYFNLNGGDSWGYYHPEGNPELIFNFKGEPNYKTSELLPEYWASLPIEQRTAIKTGEPGDRAKDKKEYVYFASKATARFHVAEIDHKAGSVEIYPAGGKEQLVDIMAGYGITLRRGFQVPTYRCDYDPRSTLLVDHKSRTLNLYSRPSVQPVFGSWDTVRKLLFHVVGSESQTLDHLLNWISCIYVEKVCTGTAWLLQGTYGTGKGLLFQHILTPLLGPSNVVSKRMEEMEEIFTSYMENRQLVFVDEMQQVESVYNSKIESKLKNLITEEMISVRSMYSEARLVRNYTNLVFASNERAPVTIREGDRRFNVGVFQVNTLESVMTDAEIDIIRNEMEVPAFAAYLLSTTPDLRKARHPLVSAARSQSIALSKTALDEAAQAIREGVSQFFWDQLPSTPPTNPLEMHRYTAYLELMKEILQTPHGQRMTLSREEVQILFEGATGSSMPSRHKFTSLLRHKNIETEQVWRTGRNVRGIYVTWFHDPKGSAQARADIAAGKI